jgi:hypothetical protein
MLRRSSVVPGRRCTPRTVPPPALACPPPPPRRVGAAELEKHFDLHHIDDSLGGKIPEAQLWSFETYGERMRDGDAAAAAAEAAAQTAAAAEAEAAKPSPEQEALHADFEKRVVVM